MGNPVIEVDNISMMFNLNKEKIDNLKEYVIKFLTRKLHFTEFWALRDISFSLQKGERLGVLGFNGAGKEHAAEGALRRDETHEGLSDRPWHDCAAFGAGRGL